MIHFNKRTFFIVMSRLHRRLRCRFISNAFSYVIKGPSIFVLYFYLSFILTETAINTFIKNSNANLRHNGIGEKAPQFQPGNVRELCESQSNAEKRIIFLETSGENCLRPRQACAIESAARTNPDMKIQVYMSTKPPPGSSEKDEGYGLNRQCDSMKILSKYLNVHFIREDLTQHLLTTPLESLFLGGKFENSKFSNQHLSDAVRIALLYKSGGIYLDLDVIVLRSLNCLRNMAGVVRPFKKKIGIENGVLIFDKGHGLLGHYMRLMEQIFNPLGRESIGPIGFLKAAEEFCGFNDCEGCDSGQLWVCRNNFNLTTLYTEAFYPVSFLERQRFYEPNFSLKELDNLQTSFVVHVYGSGHGAQVDPSSLYGFLAQHFCPAINGASVTKSDKKIQF